MRSGGGERGEVGSSLLAGAMFCHLEAPCWCRGGPRAGMRVVWRLSEEDGCLFDVELRELGLVFSRGHDLGRPTD